MIIGTILRNRYKIVQYLGGGAFGETYLAEDLDLPNHPKFVVKHLKPKTSDLEVLEVAKRLFDSEAKFLYKLGNLSRQIPKLFAHFEENGEFYLVQEFVDGCDLSAEIIPGKKWTEAEVIKLLQEILEVLAVVHQQNIIHRDIKPENLMRRREDAKIVLIDFGAVKEIQGLVADTQGKVTSTIIIGSNGYMPNEQANSKPKLSSDIYAVGVIGIQSLTGKLPQELLEDANSGEIIWQNEVKVSKKLASILKKMVYCHFHQRYPSAIEALQAVKSVSKPPLPLLLFNLILKNLGNKKSLILLSVFLLITLISALMNFLGKPMTNLKNKPTVIEQEKVDVDLNVLCPKTSLPTQPYRKIGNTEYYGLAQDKGTGKGSIILIDKNTGSKVKYEGDIENYQFHGCGTYTGNGDTYTGQFKNNKFHGQGINIFKNGDRYIGQFENGLFRGHGRFICSNGNEYVGEFKNNTLHGQVVFISKTRSVKKIEIWENGKSKESGKLFKCNSSD
ncbi:protein kinase [Anabaena sp. FACHB-1237]|uniref:protein kinase domain-containing protein n=1 Tax=Anabaena sp. FACHB-1237 TaxID=2692769 RepID=UPI001680FBB1|nr:protein kinase [Anabaena sp. FACHB-1237]MBD2138216.1 protein kinase [Anabaena sp. FACHB-1237]